PFLLIFILHAFRAIKQTLPSILLLSLTYTLLQALLTLFNPPQLPHIIPSLPSILPLPLFSNKFQPNNIFTVQKHLKP
ncbi:L-lactate permease, partial [Staphylococcus epidermidis]|uniref:L-lactate permease n=1 Tax=Staphylococcus epidermidis TaxID=1282 RepID=UPI001642E165